MLLGSPAMTRSDLENQTPAATRLRTAWGLAAAGALALTAGPLIGVVSGQEPAFGSWPLLALLALLPPVVAGALLLRGQPFVAAGLLAAAGVFAPGRLLGDVQIVLNPLSVGRPELFRAATLTQVAVAPGLWLLLLGHVLVLAGGLLAAGRAGVPADEYETGRTNLSLALPFAALATIGLVLEPFTSADPYLLARSPWDLPVVGLVGGLLVAAAPPLATALAGSSPDPETSKGGLLGVAFAITAVAAPMLASGLLADGLEVTSGPILALAAAALLLVISLVTRGAERKEPADEVALPTITRLHVIAGVFALLAGVAAIVGAIAPQLVAAGQASEIFAARLLWPSGLVLVALGLALFSRTAANVVRPTLFYAWCAVQLVAVLCAQAVSVASQSGLAEPGIGFWLMTAATPLGVVAVVCLGLAGSVERENAERGERDEVPVAELGAVLLAGLFAIGAFVLPAMRGNDYVAPGVISNFAPIFSTGLVAALLVLLLGLGVALRSRPKQGAAVLAGAALLVGTRALELPLTGGRIEGVAAAPGTWLALAAVVSLLVAAGLMGARATR